MVQWTTGEERKVKYIYTATVFGVGFALGLLSPRHETEQPEVAPIIKEHKHTPLHTRKKTRIVCTDVSSPRKKEIDDLNARLNWCEGRLQAELAPKPTGRMDWPDDIPESESPDRWAEQMDELIDMCEIPGEAVVTDCEEYPCVTLMRPIGEALEGKALREQIKNCDGLPPALVDSSIEATSVQVNCPDGTQEDALVVSGASEEGMANLYGLEDGYDLEFAQYIIHAGRRVESALELWACRGGMPQ